MILFSCRQLGFSSKNSPIQFVKSPLEANQACRNPLKKKHFYNCIGSSSDAIVNNRRGRLFLFLTKFSGFIDNSGYVQFLLS